MLVIGLHVLIHTSSFTFTKVQENFSRHSSPIQATLHYGQFTCQRNQNSLSLKWTYPYYEDTLALFCLLFKRFDWNTDNMSFKTTQSVRWQFVKQWNQHKTLFTISKFLFQNFIKWTSYLSKRHLHVLCTLHITLIKDQFQGKQALKSKHISRD